MSRPVKVHVETAHDAEPIDVDRWLDRYVRMCMELDGLPTAGGEDSDAAPTMRDPVPVRRSSI